MLFYVEQCEQSIYGYYDDECKQFFVLQLGSNWTVKYTAIMNFLDRQQ